MLFHEGLLSSSARKEALAYLLKNRGWATLTDRLLLFLGSALVLTGIVFFFAYNWAAMGRFLKFGLAEGGILLAVVSAAWLGIDRIPGKLLLLVASVLTGVFMAVYGQIYQTGADAFELFMTWTVLILAWVLIGRFQALWVFWLAVLNTGLILYWVQVVVPESREWEWLIYPILAGINSAWLIARETGYRRGLAWLRLRWARWLVLASILVLLSIPTIAFIVDPDEEMLLSVLLIALTGPGAYLYFRRLERDLFSLTLIMFTACLVVLCLSGKILFDIFDGPAMFLLFGFVIVGTTALAALWLVLTWKAIARESRG